MHYTTLGKTGLIVSRLALGAMTFGNDQAVQTMAKVGDPNAQAMVDRALDVGINFFDTADVYGGGQSETMLGKLLGQRRKDVIIATKAHFRTGDAIIHAGLSRQHLMAACEASLKRLGSDYIDLYIVHMEDPYTPLEETADVLNDLVRAGKVRYIGFSNWSAWKAATVIQMQKARGWAQFINAQMNYSLLAREIEYDMIPLTQYAGVGLTAWSPLSGGFLSGKYTRENLHAPENRLSWFDVLAFDKDKAFEVVATMREMAQAQGVSVAQIALAWLLAKPFVASIIIGASTLAQLEDNLQAIDVQLSAAQIAELDAITTPQRVPMDWVDPQHHAALGATNAH